MRAGPRSSALPGIVPAVANRGVSQALIAACCVAYIAILLSMLFSIIAPVWLAGELATEKLKDGVTWAGLALALLPAVRLPRDLGNPSDVASWLVYLCVVAPGCTFSLWVTDRPSEEAIAVPVLLLTGWFVFDWVRTRKSAAVMVAPPTWLGDTVTGALPAVLVALGFALFAIGGFSLHLSFMDVYERRFAARDIVQGYPLLGYVISATYGALIPVAIAVGAVGRRPALLLSALFCVAAGFSLDGQKSLVVFALMVGVVALIVQRRQRGIGLAMLLFFGGTVIVSLVEFLRFGSYLTAAFWTHRQIFVPAELTVQYWQFFSENPFMMMRDGLLGGLFPSPYPFDTARVIGAEYWGSSDVDANANIFASGFAHFGVPGVFGSALVAGYILRLFDRFGARRNFAVTTALCAQVGMVFTNGAVHTALLSNGVLWLLLAVWALPAQEAQVPCVA
jgi:hypothetical protein